MLPLTLRTKFELAAGVLGLVAILLVADSLREARIEAAKLKATMSTQGAVVAAASKREETRDSQLATTVGTLEKAKKAVQTPTQAISALPSVIPLPLPITLNAVPPGLRPGDPRGLPSATIPAADLKPLYDYGVACKEAIATVSVCQADRTDDAAKLTAVTKERDAAIEAAKGGSKWQRIKRSAKYLGIGVGLGAAAVCATGHCKL
jgi:hypothetical protein